MEMFDCRIGDRARTGKTGRKSNCLFGKIGADVGTSPFQSPQPTWPEYRRLACSESLATAGPQCEAMGVLRVGGSGVHAELSRPSFQILGSALACQRSQCISKFLFQVMFVANRDGG